MDDNDFAALLKFASLHGLALFAIEAGRKAPTGIVNSFAKDWSRDPEQWRRWRAENPGCNFGVVCGPSGLIIVDVDIKAGVAQWDTFADWWQANVGGEPPQSTVRTPSGGYHIYFRASLADNLQWQQSALAKYIEVRAGNGYVVARFSRTERARDSQVTSCFAMQLTLRQRLSLGTARVSISQSLLSSATSGWRLTDIPSVSVVR